MSVDKDAIKETWNIVTKLTHSERWSFILVMFFALLTIVWIVWFYVNSMNGLIDKYNTTIQQQEERFLEAQKVMQDKFFSQLDKLR